MDGLNYKITYNNVKNTFVKLFQRTFQESNMEQGLLYRKFLRNTVEIESRLIFLSRLYIIIEKNI